MDRLPFTLGDLVILLVALLVFFICLFLLIRAVVLWYWKIDVRLTALQEQYKVQKEILDELKEANNMNRLLFLVNLQDFKIVLTHKKTGKVTYLMPEEMAGRQNVEEYIIDVVKRN